jgi:iduronate 2-sulfatase
VIFAGDNGYHHNERNWWNKDTLFERSCRVPLIIAAPGVKGGQVCRSLVELVDLYPTVADYAGLAAPHPLAGQSLRLLLTEPKRKGRDAAFTLVTRGPARYGQTVRTDAWRFTKWSDGTTELYDEVNDPEENFNLAANAEHAGTVRALQVKLDGIGPLKRAGD